MSKKLSQAEMEELLEIVVCELDHADNGASATEIAKRALSGHIGEVSKTREEFINNGLVALDELAEAKGDDYLCNEFEHAEGEGKTEEIEILEDARIRIGVIANNASLADQEEFAKLLADDWDERN